MKLKDLIKHLEKNGCIFKREGGSHTYKNPTNGAMTSIPRTERSRRTSPKRSATTLEYPVPKY